MLEWRSTLKCTLFCSNAGCLLNHGDTTTAKVLEIVEFVSFICFLKLQQRRKQDCAFGLFTETVSVGILFTDRRIWEVD